MKYGTLAVEVIGTYQEARAYLPTVTSGIRQIGGSVHGLSIVLTTKLVSMIYFEPR